MNDEERLTKIEIMLGHQDRQIQDLSDMLNLQRKEMDLLARRLEQMRAKLADVEAGVDTDSASLSVTDQAARDKPPHY